jgi:hypothetical protein
MMQYGTYQRIEWHAGGCYASPRAMIRSLRKRLQPLVRTKREYRELRRELVRELFEYQEQEQLLIQRYRF